MTSLLIRSENVRSGYIYDGEWNLTRPVNGLWNLQYMKFYSGDTEWPWTYYGADELVFKVTTVNFQEEEETGFQEFNCTATIASNFFYTSNKTEIASMLRAVMRDAMDGEGLPLDSTDTNTFNLTYNSGNDTFDITYRADTNPDPLPILEYWLITKIEIFWNLSSCRGAFNKSGTQAGEDVYDTNLEVTMSFDAQNVKTTRPYQLALRIDQCTNRFVSSGNTGTTLLLPTDDESFTGQVIKFSDNTDTLNIEVFSLNIDTAPIPFTGSWLLFFNLIE